MVYQSKHFNNFDKKNTVISLLNQVPSCDDAWGPHCVVVSFREHVTNPAKAMEKLVRKKEKLKRKAHKLKRQEEKVQRQLTGSRGHNSGSTRLPSKSRRYDKPMSWIWFFFLGEGEKPPHPIRANLVNQQYLVTIRTSMIRIVCALLIAVVNWANQHKTHDYSLNTFLAHHGETRPTGFAIVIRWFQESGCLSQAILYLLYHYTIYFKNIGI